MGFYGESGSHGLLFDVNQGLKYNDLEFVTRE